jgi:hypothetical protein
MSRAFLVSLAMVLFGLVVGVARDPRPPRTMTMRAGYRVLEVDLHAHTTFSDGLLSPIDLVTQARRRGLDAFAVTEHNLLFPAKIARAWSRLVGGPPVLLGEEVTTGRYHLLAIGIESRVAARRSVDEVIGEIHAQGGLAFAAHPVARFQAALSPVRASLDGSEVAHPLMYGDRGTGFRWTEMRDWFRDARAAGLHPTAIGSSDYHGFSMLGLCRTLVFAHGDDEASILEALHAGRTVVFDRDGVAYGDETMIAALQAEPYVPRAHAPYDYSPVDGLDRIGRALGFLGVLGVVVLRPRRTAQSS